MNAFISYSHKDTRALERLHTHLAMLRRERKITAWYDRDIIAGGDIDKEVSYQLEACALFLALVSPDFLASTYCYDKEMTRAFERHDADEIRIVPIIIEPCDWKTSPLGSLKALPRDGKPVATWPNSNEAFMDIIAELRRVLAKLELGAPHKSETLDTGIASTEGQYRIKRTFDQIDRSDFRERAFEEMRSYFKSFCDELNTIDGVRGRFHPKDSSSFVCTVINQNMQNIYSGTAHITVHMATDFTAFGDIYFSFTENAQPNTMQGGFLIDSDDYDLFLKSDTIAMYSKQRNFERLTAKEAADLLWTQFIEKAGISRA